ncbi:MAG: hypothetical protein AB1733_24695 [Thermodesulfobacteriota bacterium]
MALRFVQPMQMLLVSWFSSMASVAPALAVCSQAVPFYMEVSSIWDFLVLFYFKVMALVFLASVGIEYIVAYLLLGRPSRGRTQLIFYVLLVKIITNPAAQLAHLFIADDVLLGSSTLEHLVHYLIEVAVVIVESGLIWWMCGRMYSHNVLAEPVSAARSLLISLVANVVPFVILYMVFGWVVPAFQQTASCMIGRC